MRISVIIPVHNGGAGFRRCLQALISATRAPDELIVVDDASSDASAEMARAFGARVIGLADGPQGPAAARNRGAAVAQGDVLVFLDADVAVHPDTLGRIEQRLTEDPGGAGLFGSYDDHPPARGLVARYKNLTHHYIHQHARQEAGSFWAGCGALRREVFEAAGGFDERYTRPSIEDIELGVRLRRAGYRIRVCPEVQVSHLKCWTLRSLLRADILDRAVPWTRLILGGAGLPNDLNLDTKSRLSAIAAWITLLCLFLGLWRPWAWVGGIVAAAGVVLMNRDLYRFYRRHGGGGFAIGSAALHFLYLLYSSAVFALLAIPIWAGRLGLALLLLATLFKGLAWSLAIPPWLAPDEQQHFLYAQSVERGRTLRVPPDDRAPEEAFVLADLVQKQSVVDETKPLDLSDPAGILARKAALNDPALKATYRTDQDRQLFAVPNFTRAHPPLYYAFAGIVQALLERRSILDRAAADRWFSVLLSLVTIVLAYRTGRALWPARPGQALLLAAAVSYLPVHTLTASSVSNQALEIPLFAAGILLGLRVARRGLTWRSALALGFITGLGLLTRVSFLAFLLLLALLFLYDVTRLRRRKSLSWPSLWPWALVLVVPIAVAGWWYYGVLFGGGNVLAESWGNGSSGPRPGLWSFLLHYPWVSRYRLLLNLYWDFGWLDIFSPRSLLEVLVWLTAIGVWGAGWVLARRQTAQAQGIGSRLDLGWLGCATLSLVAFYTYLDFSTYRATGGKFILQGRYFLPAVIGQMAWLIVGLLEPAPGRLRRTMAWLLGTAIMGLNLYGLFSTLRVRYYLPGFGAFFTRAALLQPVSAETLLIICAGFVVLTGVFAVALWGSLGEDQGQV